MLSPVWILPRRCTSKVRSVISTTSAALTDWTAEMTSPRCATLPHSTVISRMVRSPLASTVSTATIDPPTRVIAAVTLPSTPPGREGRATRRVSENCAEGVAMLAAIIGSRRSPLRTSTILDRGPYRAPRQDARGFSVLHRCRWPAWPGASIGLTGAVRAVERTVPDRREQPRLSRFFRPPRIDRDLQGAAHQRDLRFRVDARED